MTPAAGQLPSVIRASSVPLAMLCPGSIRVPKLAVKERVAEADLGTAAHEMLRPLAEGGGVDWDSLPAVAITYGVDENDLRVLVVLGVQLWQRIKDQFPSAVTEVELEAEIAPGIRLKGHIDILSSVLRSAAIGDWKTGRLDGDHRHQLMAYAVLVLLDDRNIEETHLRILWVREREVEPYRFTRAHVQPWLERLQKHVLDWDGVLRPGAHCYHCPRALECEAANALARRDAAAILNVPEHVDFDALTADEQIALFQAHKAVGAMCERLKDDQKARIEAHGDVVGTEQRLTLLDRGRRTVDMSKVIPILREHFSFNPEEELRALSGGLSEIETMVAAKAGRGKGAAAVRRLNDLLDLEGAIGIREFKQLSIRR